MEQSKKAEISESLAESSLASSGYSEPNNAGTCVKGGTELTQPCSGDVPYRSLAFSRRFSSRSIADRIRSSRSSPSTKAASMRALAPFGRVRLMFSSQSFLRPIRRGISRT